jgi:hypothetical protein
MGRHHQKPAQVSVHFPLCRKQLRSTSKNILRATI